jgi:Derlin-2/3
MRIVGKQSVVERPYGTVFVPSTTGETAQTVWRLDLPWQRFGPGRRLGGEGASAEPQRPTGCVLAAMVIGGFLVVCAVLSLLFVRHGSPNGWVSGLDSGWLASSLSHSGNDAASST